MDIIIGVLILIFVFMFLWHVMKECGVRATFRILWTVVAAGFLIALVGGRGDDTRH